MSKHYRARSLLYRRQTLQENIRWKALDDIYKIYMLLQRSDLNTSEIRPFFLIQIETLISTRFFATKYSLESSWRYLQDLHTLEPLRSQNCSQKSSTFFREWILNFRFSFFVSNFAIFLRIFDEISSGFCDKFQKRMTCVSFSYALIFGAHCIG